MTDTNQLPPMPKPDIAQHTQEVWIDDVRCTRQLGPRYTADQMRAYALQARAQVQGEPVYWEWRHLSTHPNTVDFGQWSEWQRVEARSAIHTIEGALAEFRAYIAQGYKYELRALYTHPAPSVPDVDFELQELREIERAMDDFADCGETDVVDTLLLRAVQAGFLECTHFHVAYRGALQEAIDAAMLAAKQKGGA